MYLTLHVVNPQHNIHNDINTLRPKQIGDNFVDDMSKSIFLYENQSVKLESHEISVSLASATHTHAYTHAHTALGQYAIAMQELATSNFY